MTIELGRLALQLAFVALADSRALLDPYNPGRAPLTPEERLEIDRLQCVASRLSYRAHEHGFHGGLDEAFGGGE